MSIVLSGDGTITGLSGSQVFEVLKISTITKSVPLAEFFVEQHLN